MKKKSIITAAIIIIILCVTTAALIIHYEVDSRRIPPLVNISAPLPTECTPDAVQIIDIFPEEPTTNEPVPSPSGPPYDAQSDPESSHDHSTSAVPSLEGAASTITIRGKTFSLRIGIDEQTLKKNIGWMESSVLPGEPGLCVVMGHRNTQFRILRLVEMGDVITIVDFDGITHAYTVISGEIVENGESLRFNASDQPTLVMVTCFPFYYNGHAPHRYLVTAIKQ